MDAPSLPHSASGACRQDSQGLSAAWGGGVQAFRGIVVGLGGGMESAGSLRDGGGAVGSFRGIAGVQGLAQRQQQGSEDFTGACGVSMGREGMSVWGPGRRRAGMQGSGQRCRG